MVAGVAQSVEQLTCNQQVGGSIPFASFSFMGRFPSGQRGQTVNLLAFAFGGSNPPLPTLFHENAGVAQLARALAFQAKGREFESRRPLFFKYFN